MEPPYKRQRLAVLQPQSHDSELESARNVNDLKLKSKFEAIFEKYSYDFADVGDEIDIISGNVVVDNGHLAAMVNETDPGDSPGPEQSCSTGRRLLRAMTKVPHLEDESDDSDDQGVMMSIEATGNVQDVSMEEETSDASESEESDNGLFDTSSWHNLGSHPIARGGRLRAYSTSLTDESSDDDLFPRQPKRNSSPDSLFDVDEQMAGDQYASGDQWKKPSFDSGLGADLDDGHTTGAPKRISHQRSTHQGQRPIATGLETARRLAAEIALPAREPSLLRARHPFTTVRAVAADRAASPNAAWSLWAEKQPKPPKAKRRRKPVVQQVRGRSLARGESEDPLQEELPWYIRASSVPKNEGIIDMTSNEEHIADGNESEPIRHKRSKKVTQSALSSKSSKGRNKNTGIESSNRPRQRTAKYAYRAYSESDISEAGDGFVDLDSDEDEYTSALEEHYSCEYCEKQFTNEKALLAHWDRIVQREDHLSADDPHLIEAIKDASIIQPIGGDEIEATQIINLSQSTRPKPFLIASSKNRSDKSNGVPKTVDDNYTPQVPKPACSDCKKRKKKCGHPSPFEPPKPACNDCRRRKLRCEHRE